MRETRHNICAALAVTNIINVGTARHTNSNMGANLVNIMTKNRLARICIPTVYME